MLIKCAFLVFSMALSAAASARPSSEEARKFVDYYLSGQGQGPVLVRVQLCTDIVKDGESKNDCSEVISGNSVKVSDKSFVWMHFAAPQGDKIENVLLQYNSGGITRDTKSLGVEGSIRYRVWKPFTPSKPGTWEIKVLHEGASGVEELGKLAVEVTE